MQRIISLLCLAVIVIATGCGDDNPTNTTSNGSISAKVNGSAWSATTIQATYQSSVLGIGGAQISGAENKQINISGLVSGPGTYQLGLIAPISVSYTEGTAANVKVFTAKSGTLKVDEISASGAKGSFSMEAQDQGGTASRSITEGTFNVKF